ncbi:tRNA (adenosine(37)-N6)-threonylcarbamoyltransferase complex dimerization subunit type 1 TsaB [Allorhizobium terrae]|uniref:tRNA (Adenosine(37)-N6)-threonylcarbamoyltransferase complex dimerization subunit type 1 TsaB n=1 Tax=Allorhizobium terrae TaxID=1848972 RepID=A0A4S3ZNR4_9HYPH|nr:tRNA (adenosine(37)-N6)-threonylcarbamoyltransferase complex dimerization subunit type 1 TsaB [Allorhizobium terrae]THF47053.1 tRNA (adenosine(37)-N6)-threonylcarbamoyltransferase complex dimerization subunit type 1 TsaB [Allorhizobium terrae]
MIVLAIDTAGAACATAIYDSNQDRILAEVTEVIGKGHAEKLMVMVDDVLAKAGKTLPDLHRIAVTIGPGSFTGIRVGLAAARGLALALGIDCVGISTLSVLASAYREEKGDRNGEVLAAMDAKRDEVYVQTFGAGGEPMDAPALVSVDDFRQMVAGVGGVAGSARHLLPQGHQDLLPEEGAMDRFPIEHVARLGAVAEVSGKPKPLYLRGPDAKPQTGFAVARVDAHA